MHSLGIADARIEAGMKRLVLLATGFLLLIALLAVGCGKASVTPPPGEEAVSSCVKCHSDKELLKEVATVPEVEEEPEEASGEG